MQTQSDTVKAAETAPVTLLDELLTDARVERSDADAYRIARQGVEAFMGELLSSRDKYGKIDRGALKRPPSTEGANR